VCARVVLSRGFQRNRLFSIINVCIVLPRRGPGELGRGSLSSGFHFVSFLFVRVSADAPKRSDLSRRCRRPSCNQRRGRAEHVQKPRVRVRARASVRVKGTAAPFALYHRGGGGGTRRVLTDAPDVRTHARTQARARTFKRPARNATA